VTPAGWLATLSGARPSGRLCPLFCCRSRGMRAPAPPPPRGLCPRSGGCSGLRSLRAVSGRSAPCAPLPPSALRSLRALRACWPPPSPVPCLRDPGEPSLDTRRLFPKPLCPLHLGPGGRCFEEWISSEPGKLRLCPPRQGADQTSLPEAPLAAGQGGDACGRRTLNQTLPTVQVNKTSIYFVDLCICLAEGPPCPGAEMGQRAHGTERVGTAKRSDHLAEGSRVELRAGVSGPRRAYLI